MRSRSLAYLGLAGAALIWGFNFIPLKVALRQLPPFTLAFVSVAGAAILLLALARRDLGSYPRRVYVDIAIAGLLGIAGFNLLLNLGLRRTSVVNASLLICTTPCWAAVFNRVFLRQPLDLHRLAAIALSVIGTVLLVTDGAASFDALLGSSGDLLILLAVLFFVGYLTVGKNTMAVVKPTTFTALSFAAGAVFLFPFAASEIGEVAVADLTLSTLASVLFVIAVTGVGANTLYNYGVSETDIVASSLFSNLIPVFAMAFATIALDERPGALQMIAAFIVITGASLPVLRDRST